jgi:hypothetical protein
MLFSLFAGGVFLFSALILAGGTEWHANRSRTFIGTSLLAAGVVLVSRYLPIRKRSRTEPAAEKSYDQQIVLEP